MQSESASIAMLILLSLLTLGVVAGNALYREITFSKASPEEQRKTLEKSAEEDLTTITLEGHDYFRCPTTHGRYVLTHKGNCKGCGTVTAEAK